MPRRRGSWLNRTVLGIGMASLLSDLSHETVTSLLPGLLATLGVAAAALGTIEGVADGLSSVAKLYGGWWTDRLRRRKPLCASGYGVMAAATLVIATAGHWLIVLAGRTLSWIARGLRTPPRKALLAEAVTPDYYGRAFGFERTMDTLGAVLAPVATLLLLKSGLAGRDLMLWATVPALLAVLAITQLVQETPAREPHPRRLLASYRDLPPPYLRLLRWIGLFGAGDFAHSLMILYATSVLAPRAGAAAAASTAVALYALHNICYAASSYPAGWLADRLSKRKLLAAGYALGALVALLLAMSAGSLPVLVLVFALGGAYVGIEETLEDSLAAELVPPRQRGAGFGLLSMVNGAGDFVSSLATGWLWSAAGPTVAFGFAGLLMAAGAAGVGFSRPFNIGSGK
ncbi:MAG: MFS transporter [Bryobacteraceae bacterium]